MAEPGGGVGLMKTSAPLRLTDLRRLPNGDANKKVGKVPISDEGPGNGLAERAPAIWSGTLNLFESATASMPEKGGSSSEGSWHHAAAFCGGPIWAMDWLGEVDLFGGKDGGESQQIVAVAAMAEGFHEVPYGTPVQGQNYVQIWTMGKTHKSGTAMCGTPSLLMLISLDSGAIHDLAWCRWDGMVAGDEGLGMICVACGDGSVLVFDVPYPKKEWGAERKVIKLTPTIKLMVDSGRGTCTGYAVAVRWGPDPEGIKVGAFVAACTTGETMLVPVAGRARDELQKEAEEGLVLLSAHDGWGLCCVAWCGKDGQFLATGGLDGKLRFWDVNKPHWPVFVYPVGFRGWITSVTWVSSATALIYVSDTGRVGVFFPRTATSKVLMDRPFTMWSCDLSSMEERLALASVEGLVMQVWVDMLGFISSKECNPRIRSSIRANALYTLCLAEPNAVTGDHQHVVVVGASSNGKGACKFDANKRMLRGRSIELDRPNVAPETKKQKKSKAAAGDEQDMDDEVDGSQWTFPDLDVAIHRVKWHPGGEGLLLWAGRAGFMHCGIVATDNLPDE